jgi:hypothetical protein
LSVSITGCPAPSPLLSVNCLKPGAIFLSFFWFLSGFDF